MPIAEQPGKGALSIDAIVQDGAFIVDNISFYDNAKLATENTAEADWSRRGLYIGPQVLSAFFELINRCR